MTLHALLAEARQRLAQTLPADEARREAQILLCEALGVNRAWLIAHSEQPLTDPQLARFADFLQRRLHGEPVAYILGKREFYGLELRVAPGVLIPRPDTETIVEAALAAGDALANPSPLRVLDLGTGSGAIALALAMNRPQWQVTAVDAAPAALAVAQDNATQLGAANLQLLASDWFSALTDETFDLIVSNPPYIAAADPHLAQGDLRFEPTSALASGTDGLDDIRRIVAQAPQHLRRGGWLLLEHGYDQAEHVAKLLQEHGFAAVGHAADLAGILRVTLGKLR